MKLISFLLYFPLFIFADISSDTAFQKLLEGNKRYVDNESIVPSDLEEKREETSTKQMPFAVVVGCSDSRVAPEIVFDQSIGDLFVVRVAGNVIGPIELDSIEFAVNKLKTPLVVVLGHQRCGAVSAVLSGHGEKDIENIVPYIQEAIDETKNKPGDPLVNAIKANVMHGIKELKKSRTIAALLKAKKLKIVGAYYELESGKIEFL